jgi:hypothetical protein
MDILHQDRLDANAKCPRLGHQKVQAGRGYLPSLQTPIDPFFLNAVTDQKSTHCRFLLRGLLKNVFTIEVQE